MNKLEAAIIKGAENAHCAYYKMTGSGWWLSHGPEYIITCMVSENIASEGGFEVYPEASPKKLKEEREDPPKRGPAPKHDKNRFDVVVWQKTYADVRAIIEIKRAYDIAPIKKDRIKISDYIKKNDFVKKGYLLVYTEARRKDLKDRFNDWSIKLKCDLVGTIFGNDDESNWKWGIGLLKLK